MVVKALFLFAATALLTFNLISILTSSYRERLKKKMDKGTLTKDEWYDT
jgi:hypothetical protein